MLNSFIPSLSHVLFPLSTKWGRELGGGDERQIHSTLVVYRDHILLLIGWRRGSFNLLHCLLRQLVRPFDKLTLRFTLHQPFHLVGLRCLDQTFPQLAVFNRIAFCCTPAFLHPAFD